MLFSCDDYRSKIQSDWYQSTNDKQIQVKPICPYLVTSSPRGTNAHILLQQSVSFSLMV